MYLMHNKQRYPTKCRQDMLVNGYIRENTKYCSYVMPMCLNQLCYSFYNTVQYFTFENELLTSLLKSTNDDIWEGKTFKINGITCQFVLCPSDDAIGFFVRMKVNQSGINTVVNASFYCEELESFHTATSEKVWDAISKEYDSKIGKKSMILMSDIDRENQKRLTFFGDIQVLQIRDNTSQMAKSIWKGLDIRMKRRIFACDCIWQINDFTKAKHFGKYVDNKNWILFANGDPEDERYFLRLLQLPENVSRIKVKCNIRLEYYYENGVMTDTKGEGVRTLDYKMNTVRIYEFEHDINEFEIFYNKGSELKKILVKCDIEICEVFTQNNVLISFDDWPKYGVDY